MALVFQNTLTRQKETFTPRQPGQAGMYTCGPTVYNFAHIGNYRAYAFEDLLRRHLEYRGYKVNQVMNITDIDDKIIRESTARGIALREFVAPFEQAFFEDLRALNIEPAEHYPRATEHIDEMVAIIQDLLDKQVAYRGEDGSIYYSVGAFPAYGKLSNISLEGLVAGARVKQDEYTKDRASDFALWKAWDAADGEVFWETPLGKGRPGWHIECSAMSMKYLGAGFDIHTGGVDNMFPHHENEIAQSEAHTGQKFVNYWLHCDHLLVEDRKMAKSAGNFFTLRDLTARGHNPMALRYLYLSCHYRSKLNFTLAGLEAAQRTLDGLADLLLRLKSLPPEAAAGGAEDSSFRPLPEILDSARENFAAELDDDLNSPRALAVFFDAIREINRSVDAGRLSQAEGVLVKEWMLDLDRVMGLNLAGPGRERTLTPEEAALVEERNAARTAKDWARADVARDQLKAKGIILEDTPSGVRVKFL